MADRFRVKLIGSMTKNTSVENRHIFGARLSCIDYGSKKKPEDRSVRGHRR